MSEMMNMNVLEQLKMQFEQLISSISKLEESNDALLKEKNDKLHVISKINDEISTLQSEIDKNENRLIQLRQLYKTTQENYEHVQNAAISLLDMLVDKDNY